MSSERTAIVTGAAGGLGAAMVDRFVADGLRVVAVDLPSAGLDAVPTHHPDGRVLAVPTDLARPDEIEAMVATTVDALGSIDVLINNAATYSLRPWTDITVEEWDHTLAVNLRAYFLCARHAHPHLAASDAGRIVNVASSTFFTGWAGLLDYVASKGGIVGFTRSLAREVGGDGITVNAVSPGAIPTAAEAHHPDAAAFDAEVLEKQCVKRRGTPADIAGAVAFLAGPGAGFVSGQTLEVDGGWVLH